MFRMSLFAALLITLASNAWAQAERSEGPRRGMPPGFVEAGEALGVDSNVLFRTMTEAGGPRAELADVAERLGISESILREALPSPSQKPPAAKGE